jgi:glycosyltransferase involved in cell wall biosynthesis
MSEPLVSVVTPFHNTAAYLAECIESVLGQTYSNVEYILVDNSSTDGSTEIAERYAGRDPRIRLIRRTQLLSQVANYNRALEEISDASRYCKMVQADDFIFPECLHLMVEAFEQSETIGLVSSYDLKAGIVRGSGIPYQTIPFPGRDIARLTLRGNVFPFGSPTTVMYRSSLVRGPRPFFGEGLLHEDTEKCMQILEDWDFAFVHQVLSFLRADNESITSAVLRFEPTTVDRYIIVQRYASRFLGKDEAVALKAQTRRDYYRFLAAAALLRRESEFWKYHENGLRTLNETLDWTFLLTQMGRVMLGLAANPGRTVLRAVRYWKRHLQGSRKKVLTAPVDAALPMSGFSAQRKSTLGRESSR